MLDCRSCCLSPSERSVPGDENSGDGDGIEPLFAEEAGDDGSSVEDVGLLDFFGGERLGYRHGAMEVVRMGSAETGNGAAGLGP